MITAKELSLSTRSGSTGPTIVMTFWSPDDSYTDDPVLENVKEAVAFLLLPNFPLTSHYWDFLDHPGRCGVLYNEPAKCYTRIINFWLLFLEV